MYERSAIVLERYFEEMFELHTKTSLKDNYNNYRQIVDELKELQTIIDTEEKVIEAFDEVAKQIQEIQKEQEKLCTSNNKLEEERIQLFNELDENAIVIEKKLKKIENSIEKNNERLKELRESFVKALEQFLDKQKERNKFTKIRREEEANNIELLNDIKQFIGDINEESIKKTREFVSLEDTSNIENELINIMLNNGKKEKIGFDKNVIECAVKERVKMAKREVECYILTFEGLKKILIEIEADNLKLSKYEKILKNISVKLAFLDAVKEYIVSFLDNERMTVINGKKQHEQMMKKACDDFEVDIEQIEKLYSLIIKEISEKATKKAYKELYDKTYLKEMEEKERNFAKEINNINSNIATVINTNYWRIDCIKNIYEIFQKEINEKFNRDFSEFEIEQVQEDTVQNEFIDEKYQDEIEKINEKIEDKEKDNEYLDESEEDDELDDLVEDGLDELEEDEEDDEFDDLEEYEEDEFGEMEEDEEDDEFDDLEEDEEDKEYEEYEEETFENSDEDYEDDDDEYDRIMNNYIKNKNKDIKEEKGIFKNMFKKKK